MTKDLCMMTYKTKNPMLHDEDTKKITASSFSVNIPDPQKDYFGNSGFDDDVPRLEDL
jgi:hypothetical protein